MPAEERQPPAPEAPEAPDARRLADRLLAALAGLDLTSADGRAGIGTLLSEIERACPGAILQQAAGIQLRALGWRRHPGHERQDPRRLVIPAKAGTRHDLPQDGLPGAGHLLGAAARGERGCGDDVRGSEKHLLTHSSGSKRPLLMRRSSWFRSRCGLVRESPFQPRRLTPGPQAVRDFRLGSVGRQRARRIRAWAP